MPGEIVVVRPGDEPPASWDASVLLEHPGSPMETLQAIDAFTEIWRAGRLVVFLAGGAEHPPADLVVGPEAMTTAAAIEEIGRGAHRVDGERDVPLSIWRTASFQRWYTAQRQAGNRLLSARPVWTFRPGHGAVFFWALHVRLQVTAEDRVKDNEVVISRPDISAVALYRPGPTRDETTIVLVREFRSPASTPDGDVHELPGGSAFGHAAAGSPTPLAQARDEVEEETGLAIEASRFRRHGSRQVAATVSAHHAHLFSAEITDEELARLRAGQDGPYGLHADGERTWVEIATYGEIRAGDLVDWATLGMLAAVLD